MSHKYSSLQLSCLTVTTFLVIISIQVFTIFASPTATRTTKDDGTNDRRKKIAIIGGGIGGTFSAKYLTDHDVGCDIHSITIFSPPLVGDSDDEENGKTVTVQGSRVKSLRLKDDDGTVVELGASVLFEGNRYASEMMNTTEESKDNTGNKGGKLSKVKPFSPGKKKESSQTGKLRDGLGVFDGGNNPSSRWPLYTAGMSPSEIKSTMIWRYNLDLKRINTATTNALSKFDKVYELLESTHPDSFVNSPDSLWDAVGLGHLAQVSLDDHLDDIGIDGAGGAGLSWWRRVLGWGVEQGLFRHELFEAINLCNNGKDNSKMTALAGLVNFVSSIGPLFAIEGGNDQLMPHALKRASSQRQKACSEFSFSATSNIIQIHQQIQTVISKSNPGGFELFAPNSVPLGTYDILILAAPLQFANINFLVHGSLFDPDLLSPMPLNGLVQNEDHSKVDANLHEHKAAFGAGYLPDSAKRGYTKVVTTVVSNAVLNPLYFKFNQSDGEEKIPRSILTTTKGQAHLHITSVGQITPDTGVYKIFSPHELPHDRITEAFGPKVIVEHVEVWGGERGGATPDFNGGKGTSATSAQFLLYDGDHGIGNEDGKNKNDRVGGNALYYVNAMEASVSAIEISAIGAKAVAKLVAKRLGLITPTVGGEEREEL